MELKNTTVEYSHILELFDDTWDLAYLKSQDLKRCANVPIKTDFGAAFGINYTNNLTYPRFYNSIVLAKKGHTWDYSHYEDSVRIMEKSGIEGWFPAFTNYKEAAIHSGLGVRARNSLVYSFKFGFDCHFCMIGFIPKIINYSIRKRRYGLWKRCDGCDDCIKKCPVMAIHDEENGSSWVDGEACQNFIFFGKDERVPSVVNYWHKNVYPEIPQQVIDNIDSFPSPVEIKWDKNGYSFDGNVTRKNGEKVTVPHCRECTSQPRCSKWDGKYPYDSLH
tara:strand:+ start:273 stop:1103 length:831 start_codon:yes stop_codon:yes gene_type:complete